MSMLEIRPKMRRITRITLALVVTTVCTAHAATVREVDEMVGQRKVVQRSTLSAQPTKPISLAGRGQAPVSEVAALAFKEDAELKKQLKAGRKGLLADPVVEEDVVETDTATILSTTTRAIVTDPDEVRKASPEFAKFRGGKEKAKLNELDAKTRKAFDEFYAKAKTFSADHPLHKAAHKSEQELLDAVVAGKGDLAVTTTIVIPKHGRSRDTQGKLKKPTRTKDGALELSTVQQKPIKGVEPTYFGVEETTEGTKSYTAKFLTGFTEGDQWEWSRRWDFPTGGYFRVKASAWYDYGLRVPVQIKGTLDPTNIRVTGGDKPSEYEVKLEASALDAPKSYYEDVGLKSADVHDGKELVLSAGLQVTFTLHVLGTDINERLPNDDTFNFSQDFRPPFGDCGTNCGFNVWIPAEITHTSVNILGIIKGSARAGVNVSGNGTARIDFEALSGSSVVQSWGKGDKKNASNKRRIALTKASQATTQVSEAPALNDITSREYGYRLSSPSYDWGIVLTPGVRADIDIKLWPIKETFTVQPLWLDALAIRLGNLSLGPHAGTKATYTLKHGRKSGDPKLKASEIAPPIAVPH
jgi:hypothetical protein